MKRFLEGLTHLGWYFCKFQLSVSKHSGPNLEIKSLTIFSKSWGEGYFFETHLLIIFQNECSTES